MIVRDLDRDTAIIFMVDSNLQRENILPSEKAKAYKMKLEAINAILSAMEGITSTDEVDIGSYRGFTLATETRFAEKMLILKGEMTHRAEMGISPNGIILRLDRALEKMPERLKSVQTQLDNLYQQREATKCGGRQALPPGG